MTMDSGTGTDSGSGSGREFEIVREFEVDSPPRDVWEAVTTGTGGWLWPMVYEPRVGGDAAHGAVVTAWDPPRHLAVRSDHPGALPPEQNADHLEHLIEPRDGGRRSWVRHVHGGTFVVGARDMRNAPDAPGIRGVQGHRDIPDVQIPESLSNSEGLSNPKSPHNPKSLRNPRNLRSSKSPRTPRSARGNRGIQAGRAAEAAQAARAAQDWDDQYEAASKHTDFYLHSLRQYLTYFVGRPVTFTALDAPAAAADASAFVRLAQELGLPDDASEGARVRLGAAASELDAVIDFRTTYFIGLRTEDALYRFFGRNHFGRPVALSIHDFAPGADAKGTEAAWHDWLTRLYA
ncbi:SRPBCC family protein [Streptomyces silvensis]|uniref:SRPBCC family protein n=1 Tax=Streptomyces silvensis TaxID=1765722 RepID=UPI000AD13FB8|nr:SRPBCC domain-containing protein [Streptomyces silvensis]